MATDAQLTQIRSVLIENGIDPDFLREFLEDKIEESRSMDKTLQPVLGKNEFYKRETKYSVIERFLIHLK